MAKKKRLGIRDIDELIHNLDLDPVLEDKSRQVRWLYNNGNKCTKVYDEKLVRIMVHRLQERIRYLEEIQIVTTHGIGKNPETSNKKPVTRNPIKKWTKKN